MRIISSSVNEDLTGRCVTRGLLILRPGSSATHPLPRAKRRKALRCFSLLMGSGATRCVILLPRNWEVIYD